MNVKQVINLNFTTMEKMKVSKVLNARSDDSDFEGSGSKREQMQNIEIKTASSVVPCCSCGDQWGDGGDADANPPR